MSIESKNKYLISRRALLGGALGMTAEIFLPKTTLSQESEFIPSWIKENYPHLKLKTTGFGLKRVSESFNIDSHILFSILLMESPDEIGTSYAGAQGPFQIMPGTRKELSKTINKSHRLRTKLEVLDVNYFEGEVFLACVYLEDERVGVPKGEIVPLSEGYFTKLHQLKMAAIKYHDGPNSDPTNPTAYGKIAGERVSEIFQLLKGTKRPEQISPEVAKFLKF